jgi:protein-disulfide isomerase-like protein with CxxC motif
MIGGPLANELRPIRQGLGHEVRVKLRIRTEPHPKEKETMRPFQKSLAAAGLSIAVVGLAACGGETPGYESMQMPAAATSTAMPHSHLTPQGTGNPFADTRTAASHMPMTAAALATGIAQAANITGDVNSPAAELRAGLTHLLQEHVYLAGIAVATAYQTGPDSAEFKTAADTLDTNSVDVAKAVGSVAGPENEKSFLQAWRSHVNDFVSYAVAAKGGDEAGKNKAVDNLLAYAKQQGVFFNKITGEALPAEAVENEFVAHITSLAAAVDAFAAGDTSSYAKLMAAAGHMPMSAKALAGGIVTAAKLQGDPNDEASELRSGLTSLLNGHEYLAGIAVFTAYTAGPDSEAFKAAAGALDVNSVELSKAVGTVAGADNEKTFLQVWRSHLDDFVGYAVASAKDDMAGKHQQLEDLDAYRQNAGAFFEKITNGALKQDAIATLLKMHIETTAGAIDSLRAALVK